ncbi:MAG: PEP-CTERM/exosortase system-associated acyltransferase [Micavibrio sp.]
MSTQQFLNACLESMHSKSFYPDYQKTFRVLRADSNALKDIVFRLRYEIYCLENHMDCNDSASATALEKDAYDDHALHYLLYHKPTDEAVGTVRIVLPREDKPLHSFPLQFICDHPLLHMEDKVSQFCEISRLCMTKDFRKRPGDGAVLPSYFDQDQSMHLDPGTTVSFRRVIPFAPLGLLRAAFEGALEHGLTDCVCILDPEQLYALQRIGLSYRVLGPRLDLMGPQQPVIFNIKHALDNMILQNPPCWEIVSDRGRLHLKANEMEQNAWHDQLFDQKCMDMIFQHLEN